MKRILRLLFCLLLFMVLLIPSSFQAYALTPEEESSSAAEPGESDFTVLPPEQDQNSGTDPPQELSDISSEGNESGVVIQASGFSSAESEGEAIPGEKQLDNSAAEETEELLRNAAPSLSREGETPVAPNEDNLEIGNNDLKEGAGPSEGNPVQTNTALDTGPSESEATVPVVEETQEGPVAEVPAEKGALSETPAAESQPGESGEEEDSESTADQGDLTAEKEGILLEGNGKFDVLVTGTIKSGEVPILIEKSVNPDPDNVRITVWEIATPVEVKGVKHVVLETSSGNPPEVTGNSQTVEDNILYIIKVEPSRADIALCKADGNPLDLSHGYEVAKNGNIVIMKVAVPDGYRLKGAWRDDDKKLAITPGDDGNYSILMNLCGGVYLSVELEKVDDDDDDDDDEDSGSGFCIPVPCVPCECTCNGETVEVVFDLNGGELNGDKGPIRFQKQCGDIMKLLEAPQRPGYRFVRWMTCPRFKCIQVSQPGEEFTVKCDVTFIAVWEAIGSCGAETDDDDDDDDDDEDVIETVRIQLNGGERVEKEINGSIRVDQDPAVGVEMKAKGTADSSVELEVEGEISVTGKTGGAVGIDILNEGTMKLKADIETEDGITVKSNGESVGVRAKAENSGTLRVETEGDIKVSSGSGESVGIEAAAESGASTTVEVEGNVNSDGKGAVLSADNGSVELHIGENRETAKAKPIS